MDDREQQRKIGICLAVLRQAVGRQSHLEPLPWRG